MQIKYDFHKGDKDICLIFLHGLGGNLYAWKTIRDYLHKLGYSTLAIDLRGHGRSIRPKSVRDYKLDYFAEDIENIINKENIKKFVLIGHCFGGVIASIYQAKYNKASAIVIIGTTYTTPQGLKIFVPLVYFISHFLPSFFQGKVKDFRKDFSRFSHTADYDTKRIIDDIKNTGVKTYASILYNFYILNNFKIKKMLKSINNPVLILVGETDEMISNTYNLRLLKLFKDSRIVKIKNASHIIVISDPCMVAKEINIYLKEILSKR